MNNEKNDLGRQTYYRSIDFVKGICILFIVITHYKWSNEERLRYLFPFWIDKAVPLFMIISGVVYANSYVRHRIVSFENAYAIKNNTLQLFKFYKMRL